MQSRKKGLNPKVGISLLCRRFTWDGFVSCVFCSETQGFYVWACEWHHLNYYACVCWCVSVCVYVYVHYSRVRRAHKGILAENGKGLTWSQEFFARSCLLALGQLFMGRPTYELGTEGKRLGRNWSERNKMHQAGE